MGLEKAPGTRMMQRVDRRMETVLGKDPALWMMVKKVQETRQRRK